MERKSRGGFVTWLLHPLTVCPSKTVMAPLLEPGFCGYLNNRIWRQCQCQVLHAGLQILSMGCLFSGLTSFLMGVHSSYDEEANGQGGPHGERGSLAPGPAELSHSQHPLVNHLSGRAILKSTLWPLVQPPQLMPSEPSLLCRFMSKRNS